MRMNKKGEESSTSAWGTIAVVVYLLYIGAVAVIIILGFMSFKNNMVGIPETVKIKVLSTRFLIADNCLAHQDATGRVQGFVMDWNKFQNDDAIRNCYSDIDKGYSFRLTLQKLDGSERKVLTGQYKNGQLPLLKIKRPIAIAEGDEIVPGRLIIDVQ